MAKCKLNTTNRLHKIRLWNPYYNQDIGLMPQDRAILIAFRPIQHVVAYIDINYTFDIGIYTNELQHQVIYDHCAKYCTSPMLHTHFDKASRLYMTIWFNGKAYQL